MDTFRHSPWFQPREALKGKLDCGIVDIHYVPVVETTGYTLQNIYQNNLWKFVQFVAKKNPFNLYNLWL